jgi:hypothetical protein
MKKLSFALILSMLVSLSACLDPDIVVPPSCPNYVELNYSNYDSLKTDPIQVADAGIDGDCLFLTLQYSGGCKEHEVDLALILPECGTPPLPPPTFEIRHNANDDSCEAWLTKLYSFDISGIREEGKNKTDFVLNVRNAAGEMISTTYTYNY